MTYKYTMQIHIRTMHIQCGSVSCMYNEALSCKTLGAFHSAKAGLQAKPAISVNAMHICRVTTRMDKYRLHAIM